MKFVIRRPWESNWIGLRKNRWISYNQEVFPVPHTEIEHEAAGM